MKPIQKFKTFKDLLTGFTGGEPTTWNRKVRNQIVSRKQEVKHFDENKLSFLFCHLKYNDYHYIRAVIYKDGYFFVTHKDLSRFLVLICAARKHYLRRESTKNKRFHWPDKIVYNLEDHAHVTPEETASISNHWFNLGKGCLPPLFVPVLATREGMLKGDWSKVWWLGDMAIDDQQKKFVIKKFFIVPE